GLLVGVLVAVTAFAVHPLFLRPPPSGPPVDPAVFGVVRYDAPRCRPGYNLFDAGHDATTYLVDMRGHVVHRWSYSAHPRGGPRRPDGASRWLGTEMLADGSLLLVHDGQLAMRLSWDSRLLGWIELPVHHALTRARDGAFYSFTHHRPPAARVQYSRVVKL